MFWLAVFVVLATLLFFILKRQHTYWSRRGVAQLEPEFFFGNFKDAINEKKIFNETIVDAYKEFKKKGVKHGGIYFMHSPIWIPTDLDLIKQIFHKDFWNFASHGFFYSHKDDILSNNIFNSEGDYWKKLRTKLSPTFSTGKLKMMFDILDVLGDRLEKKVEDLCNQNEPLNIKEVAACYSTDVIASCAFGLECDSIKDPENEFRKTGRMIFDVRLFWDMLEQLVNWDLLNFFGYTWTKRPVNRFFINLVNDMVEYREKNNIQRKDYLDLLMQLKNKGKLDDEGESNSADNAGEAFTFEEVVANTFIMYAAGFETTSTTTSFLLYELARHPDIQDKVRQEINEVCEKNPKNRISYEDLHDLKYCDMVINETLRLHTVASEVPRKCTTHHKIPGTNIVIEKNTNILIPNWAIHNDPEFYPDPRKFNPENFSDTNKKSRRDYTYFPFGGGPRLCIGIRFAVMQLKLSLVKYLRKYQYALNEKTPKLPQYASNNVTITLKGNILLDISPI